MSEQFSQDASSARRCVRLTSGITLFVLVMCGCSRDRGPQSRAISDPDQIGLMAVSGEGVHFDPGILGSAVSPDEAPKAATAGAPPAGAPLDTSTAEAAANAYAMVMRTGSFQDLPGLVIADQQAVVTQLVEALGPAAAAAAHLKKAVKEKFPDQALPGTLFSSIGGGEVVVDKVEANPSDEKLATATFTDAGKPQPETRTLHNVDGQWRIEEPALPTPEVIEQMKAASEKLAPVFEELATRVEGGQITEVQQIGDEMVKLVQGGGAEAPAAETPAAPGAAKPDEAQPAALKAASPRDKADRPKSDLEQQMDGVQQRAIGGGI